MANCVVCIWRLTNSQHALYLFSQMRPLAAHSEGGEVAAEKDYAHVKSRVETINIKEAENFLMTMDNNRPVSESAVKHYAAQMKAGLWRVNGEPIIISDEGKLLDGQHRLWAVIESQVPYTGVVVRGVNPSAFATLDTGRARTMGNVFGIVGEKNGNVLGAVTSLIWKWETKKMLYHANAAGFTRERGLEVLSRHPHVRDSVTWADSNRRANPLAKALPVSPTAFLHYLFTAYSADASARFWRQLFGDEVPCPQIVFLRRWLTGNLPLGRESKMYLAIMVKAFSNFVLGADARKLVWLRAGNNTESFPVFPGEKETRGYAIRQTEVQEVARRRRPKKAQAERAEVVA